MHGLESNGGKDCKIIRVCGGGNIIYDRGNGRMHIERYSEKDGYDMVLRS